MATAEQQRRASGSAMEAARRAIGSNNTAARRAIGASMEAQRTGRGLIDDLNSVVTPMQQGRTLPVIEARGARPAARGIANYQAPAGGRGGGIASPLQEQNYADRTFHPQQLIESSDGLFTLRIEPLQRLVMRDANNAEAVFLFQAPPAQDL